MNNSAAEQQAWRVCMKMGRQSFQQGRMAEAVIAFDQATKLLPARAESWVNLGSALLEAGRFESSAAALRNAIALNPQLMAPHMLLGDALRQLGEFDPAMASYRQAVALQRAPLALNKLACALRVNRQFEEARALYLEAAGLDPNFTLARVNLATLQIEIGQFEAAKKQLDGLATLSLPPVEREEVASSQRAVSEYFRLNGAITTLSRQNDPAPLHAALIQTPKPVLGVDEDALKNIRLYIESANRLYDATAPVIGAPPGEWPLIEAMFMIPLVTSVDEFLEIEAQLGGGREATGELLESINMEAAIQAARDCGDDLTDPVKAELHLRHWHVLACRGVEGFLPGHFKYTQNWTTRNPTLKRVDPALASGTLRHFISEMYATLSPGLPRAAVAWMAVCDLHAFADGNGRVALTWLNRELEWAGLMPALFPRELGLKGELGNTMKNVRLNGGDLTPLVAVISRAQSFALDFCAQLLARRQP